MKGREQSLASGQLWVMLNDGPLFYPPESSAQHAQIECPQPYGVLLPHCTRPQGRTSVLIIAQSTFCVSRARADVTHPSNCVKLALV